MTDGQEWMGDGQAWRELRRLIHAVEYHRLVNRQDGVPTTEQDEKLYAKVDRLRRSL